MSANVSTALRRKNISKVFTKTFEVNDLISLIKITVKTAFMKLEIECEGSWAPLFYIFIFYYIKLQAGRLRVRFPMRSFDFSIDLIQPYCGSEVDSASYRN
jgi:hypothetical protein